MVLNKLEISQAAPVFWTSSYIETGKTKKCPKCYKTFENASVSTVIGHVGAFHDEVVKYALYMLDLPSTNKVKIPKDVFLIF